MLSRYRRDAEHFEVVTPFEWDGRAFAEGEAFPALDLGLGEMQRRQLWVANKIRVVDAPPLDPADGLRALALFGLATSQPPPKAKRPRPGS